MTAIQQIEFIIREAPEPVNQSDLVQETGLAENTVRGYVGRLIRAGIIARIRGKDHRNAYIIPK